MPQSTDWNQHTKTHLYNSHNLRRKKDNEYLTKLPILFLPKQLQSKMWKMKKKTKNKII